MIQDIDDNSYELKTMEVYRRKRYILDQLEENALHQSFSPFRVKRGLSKLQVRRRVNKVLRGKWKKPSLKTVLGNRIDVRFNGQLILSATVDYERPQNQRELKKLFKILCDF